MDTYLHHKRYPLRDASFSRATCQNLSTPYLIGHTRLNGDDLHPSASSEPLIEDQSPDRTVTPNFAYL